MSQEEDGLVTGGVRAASEVDSKGGTVSRAEDIPAFCPFIPGVCSAERSICLLG